MHAIIISFHFFICLHYSAITKEARNMFKQLEENGFQDKHHRNKQVAKFFSQRIMEFAFAFFCF